MKTALPKSVIFCVAVVLIGIAATPRATAAPSDFDGVWIPDVKDQHRQETENVPPWKPEVVPQIQRLIAEEKAGRPFLVLSHCLPHGMPSWMLMTHNAFEWLTTPGRVTMLGEVDGNRMRRIYTDGRPHPEDPDPTLHGHSIGHWEGDVLVVDTTAIAPRPTSHRARQSAFRTTATCTSSSGCISQSRTSCATILKSPRPRS
jgi:hypothetical protein